MKSKQDKGSVLLTLIIFMLIATIVISASVVLLITNSNATADIEQGQLALQAAESGVEDAVIQLLRNPDYNGSFTYSMPGGSSFTYTVTGALPTKSIVSTGSFHRFERKINVTTTYNVGKIDIVTWQETF